MDQFQIEFREEKTPAGLVMVQLLDGSEIGEVLVIGKDYRQELRALQIVVPSLKGPYNP